MLAGIRWEPPVADHHEDRGCEEIAAAPVVDDDVWRWMTHEATVDRYQFCPPT